MPGCCEHLDVCKTTFSAVSMCVYTEYSILEWTAPVLPWKSSLTTCSWTCSRGCVLVGRPSGQAGCGFPANVAGGLDSTTACRPRGALMGSCRWRSAHCHACWKCWRLQCPLSGNTAKGRPTRWDRAPPDPCSPSRLMVTPSPDEVWTWLHRIAEANIQHARHHDSVFFEHACERWHRATLSSCDLTCSRPGALRMVEYVTQVTKLC